MFRNLLFFFLGALGGLCFVWPGIISNQGWICARDIFAKSGKKPLNAQSFFEDFERKLKIGSAVSPQILLKFEDLGPIDKLRILGDACFR